MFIVYKVTNKINERYYIGVHKTENVNDGYLGSGTAITRAIKKYGKENFNKEILFTTENQNQAYEKERELIQENINDPLNYNLHMGGKGGWEYVNEVLRPPNPMYNPDTAKKVRDKFLKTRNKNKEYYDAISTENLKKTWDMNRGKKRPEHSALMREKSAFLDKDVQRKARESRRKKQKKYTIQDHQGTRHGPNTAAELNEKLNIPFATLTTKTEGYIIKRGEFRGWKIVGIMNN